MYVEEWDRIGLPQRLAWIRVGDIQADPRYQRLLREDHVQRIVAEFRHEGFGNLTLNERPFGVLVRLDGMHRHEALLRMGLHDRQAPCIIYAVSEEQERKIVLLLNRDRLALSLAERLTIAQRGGDPTADAILAVVQQTGLTIGRGGIQSVATLEKVHQRAGEEGLQQVLAVLQAAWGDQAGAYRADNILAVERAIRVWQIPQERIVQALGRLSPAEFRQQATGVIATRNLLTALIQQDMLPN